jgi:hypothetical protein
LRKVGDLAQVHEPWPAKYKDYLADDAPTGLPNISLADFARRTATVIWEELK